MYIHDSLSMSQWAVRNRGPSQNWASPDTAVTIRSVCTSNFDSAPIQQMESKNYSSVVNISMSIYYLRQLWIGCRNRIVHCLEFGLLEIDDPQSAVHQRWSDRHSKCQSTHKQVRAVITDHTFDWSSLTKDIRNVCVAQHIVNRAHWQHRNAGLFA